MTDVRALEKQLAKLGHQEILARLDALENDALVTLLDSRSIKVGNNAAELLQTRGMAHLMVAAVVEGRLRTRLGKLRTLNTLRWLGRACPEALGAYAASISDRNRDVVVAALFGLVFFRDKNYLRHIIQARKRVAEGSVVHADYTRAIEALERGEPSIFSPHFRDAGGVWELD